MENKLAHFAIYIDDMERAKHFYTALFGWKFSSYGPADFMQIKLDNSENSAPIGALQARKYSPVEDKVIGFECTIQVANVDNTINAVQENNGKIILPKTTIPYVGWITKFLDTEGNLVCAMQYDNSAI